MVFCIFVTCPEPLHVEHVLYVVPGAWILPEFLASTARATGDYITYEIGRGHFKAVRPKSTSMQGPSGPAGKLPDQPQAGFANALGELPQYLFVIQLRIGIK